MQRAAAAARVAAEAAAGRGAAGGDRSLRGPRRRRAVRPRQLHERFLVATPREPAHLERAGADRATRRAPGRGRELPVHRRLGRVDGAGAGRRDADRRAESAWRRPTACRTRRRPNSPRRRRPGPLQRGWWPIVQDQQNAAENELRQARATLVDLQEQRDAALPASRSSSPPPAPSGGGGPTASPAPAALGSRLGRRRPVRVRRQLEHQHRQRLLRRPAVQLIHLAGVRRQRRTRRAPTWPRRSQQIAVAEKVLAAQGPGAWPTCGRNL